MPVAERKLPDIFYDDGNLGNLYDIPVVLPNPTREERREIRFLKSIYRGVMFVTGKARQGKDLFVMTLGKLNKRYFGRRILLDVKPRRLFGEYTYFNPRIMMMEINKMARLSGVGEVDEADLDKPLRGKQEDEFVKAAYEWIDKNEVMFKGALVYLSELRRYCYNRNPHNRVNKFVGALATQWGHLDMLLVGAHIQEHEIDQWTFLGNVNLWVTCSWSLTRLNTTDVKVRRGIYESEVGHFDVTLPPILYRVDGGVPREFLTAEETIFTITPAGMKEASTDRILSYLAQAGSSTALDVAKQLRASVDGVLESLWLLSRDGYVVGNRLYDTYNTQNLVNLVPALPKEV
jgi:hypothetical protein